MESNELSGNVTFIPQLNLWYDSALDVYLNENGDAIQASVHNKRSSDLAPTTKSTNSLSMDNINFNGTTVMQVLALLAAAVTQYNIISNKISDLQYKVETISTNTQQNADDIKDLVKEDRKSAAQQQIDEDLISNLQYRIASAQSNSKK